MVGVEGLYDS